MLVPTLVVVDFPNKWHVAGEIVLQVVGVHVIERFVLESEVRRVSHALVALVTCWGQVISIDIQLGEVFGLDHDVTVLAPFTLHMHCLLLRGHGERRHVLPHGTQDSLGLLRGFVLHAVRDELVVFGLGAHLRPGERYLSAVHQRNHDSDRGLSLPHTVVRHVHNPNELVNRQRHSVRVEQGGSRLLVVQIVLQRRVAYRPVCKYHGLVEVLELIRPQGCQVRGIPEEEQGGLLEGVDQVTPTPLATLICAKLIERVPVGDHIGNHWFRFILFKFR
mmetsp:Transcript_11133/g.27356  ORF Transcript_11133/g.27356 Transcript_11133/m.27356 type:complete len:276 (+) Transcript_11133:875-1702(+)